ncbi:hypothetical protein JHK87_024799 [Glycine soja]|nr:hypothetical protein JHK87_024799 [Glycine soja]
MESLASSLHEVSADAREAKENLLNIQAKSESYDAQIEDLKLVLKATNEKYESMLDEARHEIDVLVCSIENSKSAFENSKAEREQRELQLVSCIKKMKKRREEEAQLKENLKEVEAEAIQLQEALKETTAENMKLKENLLDKENELHCMFQENDELRITEPESIKKVDELSKLLEEATTRNHHTKDTLNEKVVRMSTAMDLFLWSLNEYKERLEDEAETLWKYKFLGAR